MTKYRRKPRIIEAYQYFQNITESRTARVRHYRSNQGDKVCEYCGKVMDLHGWLAADHPEGGYIVCPGDWIITGTEGGWHSCKPDIFEKAYELVEDNKAPMKKHNEQTNTEYLATIMDGLAVFSDSVVACPSAVKDLFLDFCTLNKELGQQNEELTKAIYSLVVAVTGHNNLYDAADALVVSEDQASQRAGHALQQATGHQRGSLSGSTPRYFLGMDDSCHWYIIPEDNREEWQIWTSGYNEELDVPEFAVRINGSPCRVTFTNPKEGGIELFKKITNILI